MNASPLSYRIMVALLSVAASQSFCLADGVIMTNRTNSTPEYWTAVPYKSLEKFALSIVVHSPAGEKITVPNPEFGDQIEFPDLAKDSFVTAEDAANLKAKREKLAAAAARYKKASGLINPVVTAIDTALENLELGRVLVGGTWMNRNEYDQKMRETTGPKGASVASVPFKGSFLKNVRVSAVRGDRISLVHDGGIATLTLSEIPADVLTQLKAISPQFFTEKVAGTSTPVAPSSPSVSGTPLSAPMPPSEMIAELRVPSGGIRGDDVYRQVHILAVEPDGLKITHESGTSKIAFEKLPVELRAKFKFDPVAAAEFRAKTDAQQKEANKLIADQRLAEAMKQKEAQVAEAKYMSPTVEYGATILSDRDWANAMVGNFSFEKGKAYVIGSLAKFINTKAILGTFDTETTSYMIVPQEGEDFPEIQVPIMAGIPIPFHAIGRYEKQVSSGRVNVPMFRCLYLEVKGKQVFKSTSEKLKPSASVSENPTSAKSGTSASKQSIQRFVVPLKATKEECERRLGHPKKDMTEAVQEELRAHGKKPEFDETILYEVSGEYAVAVDFKKGRSINVLVRTRTDAPLSLEDAIQIFKDSTGAQETTDPQTGKGAGIAGETTFILWSSKDGAFTGTFLPEGAPSLTIRVNDDKP